MPKFTVNPDIFSIMTFFENDGDFNEWILRDNGDEYYFTIIVPTLIPAGVERNDIDTVLRFREKAFDGRTEFRNTISAFTEELKNITDKDYAQEVTDKFVQQLEHSKLNIFESRISIAKKLIQKLIPSFIAVGLPTAISTLGLLRVNSEPFSAEINKNTICIS